VSDDFISTPAMQNICFMQLNSGHDQPVWRFAQPSVKPGRL